jgi:predicted amidophosphoribosyltransferase
MRTLVGPATSSFVAESRPAPFRPVCPSCCQGMRHAPGYFHCSRCGFGLREDYGGEELEKLLVDGDR